MQYLNSCPGGAAAAIAPIFLKSIQQAPGVAKIIWPLGSVQRETIEVGDLQNQLATVVEALEPRISQALATVMGKNQTNISAFLAFAGRGDFSKPRDQFPDIASDISGLLIGFTTFLVSEALVLDDWHAVASLDTDPLGLTNASIPCPHWTEFRAKDLADINIVLPNCTKLPHFNYYDLDCHSYDEYGQCSKSCWWYSWKANTAYTLAKDPYHGYFQSASKVETDPTNILQRIFVNKWSTGKLLLENAGLCVLAAGLYENPRDTSLADLIPNPLKSLADFKGYVSENDPYFGSPLDDLRVMYDLLKSWNDSQPAKRHKLHYHG